MNFQILGRNRLLCLRAAAKRLQIPERTLRYQASRGLIQGAFKQGKLWKFSLSALERAQKTIIILSIVAALSYVISPAQAGAAVMDQGSRRAAPDFILRNSKGASIRLSKYKGKVVLLNFWATSCGGCKVEIPWFMEFESKYKGSGLEVIGVSLDDDGWKSVTPYLKEKPMNYPVVIGNDDVAKRYGVDALPMTLLIDPKGRIAASRVGLVDKNGCESEIRTLLQEKAKK
jgi:cytochrome c biogenesis protein CcmG/thiol:disulfide interchange protein DsbE